MKTEHAARLGAILKSARVGLEMSLAQTSEITELPQVVIAEYEDGNRSFAYPHELFALAGALNYPYTKLMEAAGHVEFHKRHAH